MWKLTCFELSPLPICSFAGNKAVGSDKLNRSPDTIGTDRGGGGRGEEKQTPNPSNFYTMEGAQHKHSGACIIILFSTHGEKALLSSCSSVSVIPSTAVLNTFPYLFSLTDKQNSP